MALILLISTTAIMSQAVVKERERGTLEQLFVTPITRTEYLIGKIVPYMAVASLQVTMVFIVGILWFRVPFNGSVLVLAAALLLFMLSAIGQGLFVSTISRTRMQAQQATMFMLIPSMVLSGFIFPLESMPKAIVPITYLIPLRYIIVVVRANFIKGAGFDPLWPQFAAMAVFSVLIFLAALARFRKRLAD
jgi:ABC-2 type transport system permease protein